MMVPPIDLQAIRDIPAMFVAGDLDTDYLFHEIEREKREDKRGSDR